MLRFFVRSERGAQGQYDAAVLSEAPWRTAAAVAAAQIPVRIGLARHRNDTFPHSRASGEDPQKPVVREQGQNAQALRDRLARPPTNLIPLRSTDAVRTLGERFRRGSWRSIRLPATVPAAFRLPSGRGLPRARLARHADCGSERRGARASSVEAHPTRASFYADTLGDGSLASTAAALSRATCMVGHDSGPLHLAAAFGVPVVGVFAPGQPERTFPQGAGVWRMLHRKAPTRDHGVDDRPRDRRARGLAGTMIEAPPRSTASAS